MKNGKGFYDEETHPLSDPALDILSHKARKKVIHILSLDVILTRDIRERIAAEPRLKGYTVVVPRSRDLKERLAEIEAMAIDTVSSRLLIIDVRRRTLPLLQKSYNKVVGYNRKDFNKLCFTILVGDGPMNLFRAGKSLDVFVPHLADHRVVYHPAVFFYDPFLHYEPDELGYLGVDDSIKLSDKLPKRFAPYFEGENVPLEKVRRYFRAPGKSKQVKEERLKILVDLYEKRIAEQFPHHKDQLKAWLSKDGISLATERMHLYPLFFEEWVCELAQRAAEG